MIRHKIQTAEAGGIAIGVIMGVTLLVALWFTLSRDDDLRPCLEDLAEGFCAERGRSFGELGSSETGFYCLDEWRERTWVAFTAEEIDECKAKVRT